MVRTLKYNKWFKNVNLSDLIIVPVVVEEFFVDVIDVLLIFVAKMVVQIIVVGSFYN